MDSPPSAEAIAPGPAGLPEDLPCPQCQLNPGR